MGSINFNGLQKVQITNNNFLYTDLHLDIANPVVRDLETDNDEAAIRNSLFNLFNTIPGQNLLNPTYGLNLMQYLFQPVSPTTARQIGETILKNISDYEPRVKVDNISIEANPDQQMYTITLSIIILQLNQNINIPGILNSTGYTFL